MNQTAQHAAATDLAPEQIAGGAFSDMQDLLRLRLSAKELDLSKQKKVFSQGSGGFQSSFRGRGVDFAEVRHYQPGDDVRNIDWRVTARTQKTHTKVFREEQERPVLILCDQSEAMFFGSTQAFKSVRAVQAAGLLAWAALARGDRVGGLVFNQQGHQEIRPKRSKQTLLHWLNQLHQYNQALGRDRHLQPQGAAENPQHSLHQVLQQARQTVKPGSLVFIISDFRDLDVRPGSHNLDQQMLSQLSRHNDLVAIQVYDPLEAQLPPPGLYQFTDGQQRYQIDSGNRLKRQQFQQLFAQRAQQLRHGLGQLAIPLIQLSTADALVETLALGLGLRARQRAR